MNKMIIVSIDVLMTSKSNVYAGPKEDEVPQLVRDLQLDVLDVMKSEGFKLAQPLDTDPSHLNDGWAYYDVYTLPSDNIKLKLLINIRSANHASKPNLSTKNKKREDKIRQKLPQKDKDTEIELLDGYYTERDWGVQYYLGKGDKYSDPVDSIEKFNVMLKGQLNKLKDKYLKEADI